MKKTAYFIIMIFSIVTVTLSYRYIVNLKNSNQYDLEEIAYTDTRLLPDKYTPDTAKAKGDVVIVDLEIYNKQKLEKFIDSVSNNRMDKVRIVVYTSSGDALIEELYYDGSSITLVTDNTRQKDILSEYREVNTYSALNIVRSIKEEGILYVANLEDGEKFDIAFFKKADWK